MTKTLLCFLLLTATLDMAQASEKAFYVLLGSGFREDDLVSVVKKFPELKDLEVSSDSVEYSKGEVKFYSEEGNDLYTVTKNGSDIEVVKSDVQFEVEMKDISGPIHHTLFESIIHETHSANVARQVADAFKDEFESSKGLKRVATYDLQIEQYFDNGKFIKYGNVLKATLIVGKAMSKKMYQLDPQSFSWALLPENFGKREKPFYMPIESSRLTSLFQLNRHHPVTRKFQPHNGLDIGAPSGMPIFPAMAGEVVTKARTRSKGNYITILHDNGLLTTYIHMKKFEPGLKVGMWVDLEDQIGEVGRTGYCTGAHLHFGVIEDGYFINPAYLLKSYAYSQKDQHADLEAGIIEKGVIESDVPQDEIEE
jgi:murein DD-endopeptidase MepM/ murein hydrolase activator NlpD